ncbi:hypothetical protein CDL15_Pgr018905 [Punica granatum]|uniref:Uncharacterized protein n=1 Tax=Punica granatum TaxID=22663 RepID=A0A218WM28_PUNGR|nr:hypothetical protein CDL15_Pgr018905 [Punica granatum]
MVVVVVVVVAVVVEQSWDPVEWSPLLLQLDAPFACKYCRKVALLWIDSALGTVTHLVLLKSENCGWFTLKDVPVFVCGDPVGPSCVDGLCQGTSKRPSKASLTKAKGRLT